MGKCWSVGAFHRYTVDARWQRRWISRGISAAWISEGSVQQIAWDDFQRLELRVGTVVEVRDFPEARKPAYQLVVDFGPAVGRKNSSAQITDYYDREGLLGRQVLGLVNVAPKRVGPFLSECLITGFYRQDGTVVLAVPDGPVPNGARLA